VPLSQLAGAVACELVWIGRTRRVQRGKEASSFQDMTHL
jgi:hypothetical protein